MYDILEGTAIAALELQDGVGRMPHGHNGPYHDTETPVRNTAHWAITFLKAYSNSGQRRFFQAARRAAEYLCSNEARPMRATFWLRQNPEKDFCNGLVGQAWTIEALATAAGALEDETCQQVAEEVFLLHPFNESRGLWRRVNVDGSYSSFDMTFNHQLWFAAAGSLLLPARDVRVLARLQVFLDGLHRNLDLYPSGLIRHPLQSASTASREGSIPVPRSLRYLLFRGEDRTEPDAMHHKSIGYHAFNLYGFAVLCRQMPNHEFWRSPQLVQALDYIHTSEYSSGLTANAYGYPYNPVGFEIAYALQVFGRGGIETGSWWVSEQLRRCYDASCNMMTRGTADPPTHAARVYEATRLSNLPICC